MGSLATTKLSKGQVEIPEEIRERLGLKEGTEFVVLGEGDVVVLISSPAMEEFDELVRRARDAAREAGMKPADLRRAVSRARGSSCPS